MTQNTLSVTILEREYMVACPEGAEEELERSARYLDRKMNEIKSSGKVFGLERIAVMAALNLTHELLNQAIEPNLNGSEQLDRLVHKIDDILNNPS